MLHPLGIVYDLLELVEKIALQKNLKGAANIGIQRGLDLNPTIFVDWHTPSGQRFCRVVVGINLKYVVGPSDFSRILADVANRFNMAIKVNSSKGA